MICEDRQKPESQLINTPKNQFLNHNENDKIGDDDPANLNKEIDKGKKGFIWDLETKSSDDHVSLTSEGNSNGPMLDGLIVQRSLYGLMLILLLELVVPLQSGWCMKILWLMIGMLSPLTQGLKVLPSGLEFVGLLIWVCLRPRGMGLVRGLPVRRVRLRLVCMWRVQNFDY